MATFTAVRNKKQTAGTMAGVMKYVVQRKKTMLGDRWMVTGHNCVAQSSYLENGHHQAPASKRRTGVSSITSSSPSLPWMI